jgi:hypothetical protein
VHAARRGARYRRRLLLLVLLLFQVVVVVVYCRQTAGRSIVRLAASIGESTRFGSRHSAGKVGQRHVTEDELVVVHQVQPKPSGMRLAAPSSKTHQHGDTGQSVATAQLDHVPAAAAAAGE